MQPEIGLQRPFPKREGFLIAPPSRPQTDFFRVGNDQVVTATRLSLYVLFSARVFDLQIGEKIAVEVGRQNFLVWHTAEFAQAFDNRGAGREDQGVFHKIAVGITQGHRKLGGDNRADQHGLSGPHRQREDITRIVQNRRFVQRLNFEPFDPVRIAFDLLEHALYCRPLQSVF